MNNIEVCFTPALYPYFENREAVVVVVDILRASTAICTAFMNGVKRIIPVETLDEAKLMKERGFMVAAERDGIVRDFADFGNSPFNFTHERVKDKEIVYSTTNGTQAIKLASSSYLVIIGSFLNFSAIIKHIINEDKDILILCAGWKNKFNLEDTLYAGALTDHLLAYDNFQTICDSALASQDLWKIAENNLIGYIQKAAQRHRLRKNRLDDVIEYCHIFDQTSIIPVLENDYLVRVTNPDHMLK